MASYSMPAAILKKWLISSVKTYVLPTCFIGLSSNIRYAMTNVNKRYTGCKLAITASSVNEHIVQA